MTVLTPHEREAWQGAAPDARLNRTDAGNGEHFARLLGDRVRYDHRRNKWLLWSGHRWREDDVEAVRWLGVDAARDRYSRAALIEDLEERKREAAFAIASENRQRLDAMLLAARGKPPIADAGDKWDLDPWLLGVADGVVDLRTGLLRPGHPTDRITRSVVIPYLPDAVCPRWERFLEEVFQGDDEVIDFVWRAIGYSLTGDIREQCLFMCHGTGSNGKSVLLTVLRALAGEYAIDTPFSTFELAGRASIPNDVAALVGRRLVTAAETGEGKRLNEARLKALTGGDAVTARFLFGEFFSFQPMLKLWLSVNHRPRVVDDSYGFWRRVRLIPFERRFTALDRDDELTDKLLAELPGILAWAVRGARIWLEHGLTSPDAVRTATDSYRSESDPIGDFVATACTIGEGLQVSASGMYAAYRMWAQREGMADREILTSTMFGRRAKGRFESTRGKAGVVYLGVGLGSDEPDQV
jgi:putative DNA primase/helicase